MMPALKLLLLVLLSPVYLVVSVLRYGWRLLTGAKDRKPQTPEPGAGAATPQRRRWALALGDILAQRNGLPVNGEQLQLTLAPDALQCLAAQLLRELDLPERMEPQAIATAAQAALGGWVHGLGRSQHDFYDSLAAEGHVRDALAFECARTAFLVRCMALLGWVSEQQAWTVLLLNAQRAQDSFDSWADFGHAYARARQQWLALSAPDTPASRRAALEVQSYLENTDSSWACLPWKDWRIFAPELYRA